MAETGARGGHLVAHGVRKRFQHLAARPRTRVRHAKRLQLRHGAREDHRQRFGLVGGQTRQAGPIVEAKLDAAPIALMDNDRQTRLGQRIDITQDGSPGDFKFAREVGAGKLKPICDAPGEYVRVKV